MGPSTYSLLAVALAPPTYFTILLLSFLLFLIICYEKILLPRFNNGINSDSGTLFLKDSILTQETERQRISKDLHDSVGSDLSIMFLCVQQMKLLIDKEDEAFPILNNLQRLLDGTVDKIRRISHDLMPVTLNKFGILEALKELTDTVQLSSSFPISLEFDNEDLFIEKNDELQLFRIIQELISNSIKHGNPSGISISLQSCDGILEIMYTESGNGFTMSTFKKGIGFYSIVNRAKLCHAKLQINALPGKGMNAVIKYVLSND